MLAGELCQMLAAKEEYLRVSRTFLREFVRSLLRVDFDFALFTRYLFETLTEKYVPTAVPVGDLFYFIFYNRVNASSVMFHWEVMLLKHRCFV